MLVDTGATATCAAIDVMEKELGLRQTGVMRTRGAGGVHENPLYFARFILKITDKKGHTTSITREAPVMGIPELEGAGTGIRDGNGDPVKLIGLLGRDFLSTVKLIYDGPNATVNIKVDLEKLG